MTTPSKHPWIPFPMFVIRSTGFSYSLLEGLRSDPLVTTARRAATMDIALTKQQGTFLERIEEATSLANPVDLRYARAIVKAVHKRRTIPDEISHWVDTCLGLGGWTSEWNRTISNLQAVSAQILPLYTEALTTARYTIRDIIQDERVREAIFLMTPEVLDRSARHLVEHLPTSLAPNQDERKIAMFLQRLCAKCETNAFAGPIAYGAVGLEYPSFVNSPRRQERKGFVAYWAARALAVAALSRSDNLAERRPLRGPRADLIELPNQIKQLVDAVDGVRTWTEVARFAGAAPPSAAMIIRLDEAGIVLTAAPLPASEPDALATLEGTLSSYDQSFLEPYVQQLHTLTTQFAYGGVSEKQVAITRAETLLQQAGIRDVRRGAGELYVDRMVLYEEDLDGTRANALPEPVVATINDELRPVLDIAAAIATLALADVRQQTREDFIKTFPGETTVSLRRFLAHIALSRAVDLNLSPVTRALNELVRAQWDERSQEVALSVADINNLLAPFISDGDDVLLASPDILLSAPTLADVHAGRVDIIVGEIHWGLQMLGNLCCFIADRAGLIKTVRSWLANVPNTEKLVNVALNDRFGKMCFLETLPRTLELSGVATRGQAVLRPSDVVVNEMGQLWTKAGEAIMLVSGDPEGHMHTPFAPPALRAPTLRVGNRCPRIRIGRAILQRATWWVATEELAAIRQLTGSARYAALVRWCEMRGIPDRIFVRLEHEHKPLHVDLGCPHLVDVFVQALRSGEVRITEMLPEPSDLWLGGSKNGYPCELRFCYIRSR